MTSESESPGGEPTEYEIPLSDDELRELGRFQAIFSQVDFLLNEAISALTETPWWAMSIMLETATTGTKLNMLRKILPDVKDKVARHLASEATSLLSRIIERRNHVVHGMWARQLVTPQKAVKVACHFQRHKDNPVFPEELRKLSDKGAKATRYLGDLLTHLAPPEPTQAPWTAPRTLVVSDRDVSELGWYLGRGELAGMGPPNRGRTLRAAPPGSKKR